jgi:uncharacterized protein (UPF0548 family)
MRTDRALAALSEAELSFEPRSPELLTPALGWHVDALSQRLPDEPPGDPTDGGPWWIARRLAEEYRMADPAIVRPTWEPGAPLLGRVILLELRLYRTFSVHVGVRVTRVWDEPRVVAGRQARVFGYEYATLRGHVEVGQMDYEVYKWCDDGSVEFRLRAYSRASHEGPRWVRLGFRLFGRREQVRFYFRCCERIARLTARELGLPDDPPPPTVRLLEADAPDSAPLAERLPARRTRAYARRRPPGARW